ncbi:MAG: hypothetical protein K8963_05810, partial [Proteobacteria bacterium]|nr:hypothetical protein [Pseudomonadota bacterium]
NITLTGQQIDSALGTVEAKSINYIFLTGEQINSAVGQVSPAAGSVVSLTGQSVTISLGTPLVWGEIDTSQSPGYSQIVTS